MGDGLKAEISHPPSWRTQLPGRAFHYDDTWAYVGSFGLNRSWCGNPPNSGACIWSQLGRFPDGGILMTIGTYGYGPAPGNAGPLLGTGSVLTVAGHRARKTIGSGSSCLGTGADRSVTYDVQDGRPQGALVVSFCSRGLSSGRLGTLAAEVVGSLRLKSAPAGEGVTVGQASTDGPWQVMRSPQVRISVSSGCPASVTSYEDVANTFVGPPLVPAHPSSGIVCWYNAANSSTPGLLVKQLRLDPAGADALASAIGQLSLAPPSGGFSCPSDIGRVIIIGFSYPAGPDVGLWYAASGCETLDNGHLGSFEGANPSFFVGYLGAFDKATAGSAPPSA